MAQCPYCGIEIADDLSRFGGPCPNCFNEVPGEEAATDPGLAAKAAEAEARKVEQRKKTMAVGFMATVAVLVVGGVIAFVAVKQQQERAAIEAILAWEDTAVEEIAMFSAEELAAMGEAGRAAEAEAEARRLEEEHRKATQPQEARLVPSTSGSAEEEPYVHKSRWDEVEETTEVVGGVKITTPKSGPDLTTGLPGIDVKSGPGASPIVKGVRAEGSSAIKKMVEQYMNSKSGEFRTCYEIALNTSPGLRGVWDLSFRINTDGTTSNIAATPRGASSKDFEDCLVRQVSRWQFNETDQAMDMKKAYRFGQ